MSSGLLVSHQCDCRGGVGVDVGEKRQLHRQIGHE